MSRKRRVVHPGDILHVVNRGNDKRVIFPETQDYPAFLVLLREARERFGVQLLAYCLMPNHFHLVLRVENLEEISAYMLFVQREHACDLRARARTRGLGHVFQRRYWSKAIEGDGHLLTLMRYVEANPLRAALVERAQEWEWSSLWDRTTGERDLLHPSPFALPEAWEMVVNTPLQAPDLQRIRRPLKTGRPAVRDLRIT
jgi:putative transposase